MATVSQVRGSPTALTITLASLASSATAGRESTAVDNSSTLAVDYELGGFITTGTSPGANTPIEIWCYGSYDGTSYTGGAAGTDGALTPVGSKSLMRLIQVIYVTSSSNIKYTWQCGSVANLFGGLMPVKFGIWVLNTTTVNLNATGGNHEAKYTSIKYASA